MRKTEQGNKGIYQIFGKKKKFRMCKTKSRKYWPNKENKEFWKSKD